MTTNYFKKWLKIGVISGFSLAVIALGYIYYVSQKHLQQSEKILKSKNIKDLNLTLTDLDGKTFDINTIKDKKILVNFWATWCAPCLQEMPLLQDAYNKMNADYTFILISDEPIEKIIEFKAKKGYNFLFLKSKENIPDKVGALPTSFILNIDKDIIFSQAGAFENMNTQKFVDFIKKKK